MQCCVTLPKNKIFKIQSSAHQNPDICSFTFWKIESGHMEMMVLDKEADVEVNQEVDKEMTKVVEEV